MTEFGHNAGHVAGMFIDSWGTGPFEITVKGKTHRFEDSDRWGPHRLNADGELSAVNFGARSPFWGAHSLWVSQGRQVAPNGVTCVWRDALPTIVQKIGPMRLVIQHGEPDARGFTKYVQVEAPKREKGR